MENTKYIAVIPAFEPDERLPKITKELEKNGFIVIVVNDGSDISYDKYFGECNAKIISYPTNRGKGYALKKGFEYIKNNFENYIVVTIDSDGQHKVEDAINVCEYAETNRETLVIGKRLRKENVPIRSLIGNTITKFVFELATSQKIYDTQSGLRAFSEELIDYMLEIEGNRFEYEMNVLLNLKDKNIKYKEIEIQTIYIDNNKKSHFRTIKDAYRIYSQIVKYKATSVIPLLIDLLVFGALIILSGRLLLTNAFSKIIAIAVYYFLNKKEIFKDKPTIKTIGIQLGTIIVNIVLSTLIIFVVSKIINTYLAKVITEIIIVIIMHKLKEIIK